ncbi:MAG: ABC transporter substrate-binding protein [Rhizobiales bacterium]|nr:ABC transporter substrate-binding protein [Hyphomicrobiales bacterium]
MRLLRPVLLSMAACLAATISARAADIAPKRIVSINFCTDILALPLAAPGTIASVFRLAADPKDSPVADLAKGIPLNDARTEEILAYHPDLVLAHQYTSPFVLDMLARAHVPVVQIGDAASMEDIRNNVRIVARAMHREAEGAIWLKAFDRVLAASARPVTQASPRAMLYQDLGSAAAPNSVLGALITHTGFRNVITEPTPIGLAYPDIETVIALHPDLMVLGIYREDEVSQANATLQHPALVAYRRKYARTLNLPARQWTCGTPFVAGVARQLAMTHDDMMRGEGTK